MGLGNFVKLTNQKIIAIYRRPLKLEELWEQFDATIHCKTGLNFIEKLMYLQDALKDGPVRFVTQGLTQTSKSYEEAIKCLKEQYNRPRLVYEEHIHSIVDAVP